MNNGDDDERNAFGVIRRCNLQEALFLGFDFVAFGFQYSVCLKRRRFVMGVAKQRHRLL